MKEVFTKSFWQGVKKTFDQAREDPAPSHEAFETPAEGTPSASSSQAAPAPSAAPSSPPVPSETSGTTL
jgi:hypothetical protein